MRERRIAEKTTMKSMPPSRCNNFAAVRLVGTMFVFAGHMGGLLGVWTPLFGGFPLHEMGVMILFLISGYLITKSWLSDPHPLRYAIRRFFRLWPPFAVFVLFAAFIGGPLLSDLGVRGYFQSEFWQYLHNLRFYISYSLPGVFADHPITKSVNGSLWTMPVEAAMYVLTPLVLSAFRVRYRSGRSFRLMTAFAAASILFDIYLRIFFTGKVVSFYATDLISAYHLIVMYIMGMLFTYDEMRKYLNLQVGCLAMCLLLVFQETAAPVQYLALYLLFPYAVFSFVFTPNPLFSRLGSKLEPSYGIYLYGFFFQQVIITLQLRYGVNLNYVTAFALSFLPTLIAACLSYYLVEKPALKLGGALIRRWK